MMVIPGNTVLVGSATLLLLLGEEVSSFVHYTPSHSVTASRQWAQTRQKVVIQAHENPGSLSADNSVADRRTMLEKIVQSTLAAAAATPLVLAAAPSESNALSPEEAATAYDSYAATYNDLDGGSAASMLGINEARGQLLRQAKGHVLELAVGTGLNLGSYNPQQLLSLTLVDISDGMLQEAKTRFNGISKTFQGVPVKFVKADATSQELVEMFGERSFDTVVDTFSLCVFGNEGAEKCLDQIRKIVKTEDAGGRVLLLENSRSTNPFLGLYQDATADAVASMGGKGCVYNQDVERFVRGSGMLVLEQQGYAAGFFRSFVCAAPP